MASQWTIPKLVTWRVKDWASCFLTCKIPLDVDEERVNNNENSTKNNNLTFKRIKRRMKSTKKKRLERKLSLSPPGTRHHHNLHIRSSSVSPTTMSQHRRLCWPQPPVSDEAGFIVFSFDRQDGDFNVVKEEKKEKGLSSEKSPRTENKKLIYGDQGVEGTGKNNSLEIHGTEPDHHKDNISYQETEDVSSDVHEEKEEEEEIDASVESIGSSNPDEGRGSFAFPILGVEWMGSPVQMPKSDDLSPKKHKAICFRVPML